MAAKQSTSERFWAKADRSGGSDACWLWTAARFNTGYGRFHYAGRAAYAHRVSWELERSPIPNGLCVLHHCDVPLCVNPRHLFVGTHADNMADRDAKGRQARGDRSGARLHPERMFKGPWNAARGDRHWARTHPEKLARGERHGARTHPEAWARGENNGRSKLTECEVLAIRAALAAGEIQADIARKYGVRHQTIARIKIGRTWTRVQP